jgi:hypothetical protein
MFIPSGGVWVRLAVMARIIRPTAKTMAAIILFCGIGVAIIGPIIHGMTWMSIRSAILAGAISSSSPMEAVVKQGGILLNLWIIAVALSLVIWLLIVWSGIRRPRAIPLWLAFLNPIVLNLLISTLGSFSEIGRSYIVLMAANLAHIGFFIAFYWYLHSGEVQQPAYS